MPAYYEYLMASFPMLHFAERPLLSFAKFLNSCRGFIAESKLEFLSSISLEPKAQITPDLPETEKKWQEFERLLRNELVKARAARKKVEAEKFLRSDGYAGVDILYLVAAAMKTAHPLEAEKMLDEARWLFLDGLVRGHYFDFTALIVYAYKLRILERWERILASDKKQAVEAVLGG